MAKEIFQMRERLTERDEEVAELKAERSNIKVQKCRFLHRLVTRIGDEVILFRHLIFNII